MESGNQDMSHHALPTPMASWLNRVWISHLTSLRSGLAWQRALRSEREVPCRGGMAWVLAARGTVGDDELEAGG